jgi:hypothetical protein
MIVHFSTETHRPPAAPAMEKKTEMKSEKAKTNRITGEVTSLGRISPGDGVTLGDAVFAKSPMKMVYRKFPKTASLPVICHPLRTYGISLSEWEVRAANAGLCFAAFPRDYGLLRVARGAPRRRTQLLLHSVPERIPSQTRAFTRCMLFWIRSPSVRFLQYRTFNSFGPKSCTSANPIRLRSPVSGATSK